jgi:putative flippase GtrA
VPSSQQNSPTVTADLRLAGTGRRRFETIKRRLAVLSRFSFVGAAATAVYLIVANAIMATGLLAPGWASLVAYLAGMVFSFLGQSQFTFRSGRVTSGQAARFVVLSACGISISFAGINFLVTYTPVKGLPATLVTAAAIALISFIVMHIWVFRPARRS